MALALLVLIGRDDVGWRCRLATAVAVLSALSTLGGLLDRRRGAWLADACRCAATVAGAAVLYFA